MVLVVAQPLPEFMSLLNLVNILRDSLIAAATVVVFSAPLSIVTLTWFCLESTRISRNDWPLQLPVVPWSSAHVTLPQPRLPEALVLLGIASTVVHLSYSALQQRQRQRCAVAAAALTDASWKLRPLATAAVATGGIGSSEGFSICIAPMINAKPQIGTPVTSPFPAARQLITPGQQTAEARVLVTTREATGGHVVHPPAAKSVPQPSQKGLQQSAGGNERDTMICSCRLREVQVVLFGEDHALEWSQSTPQTFENVVFETGRLCGLVGVAAPSNGGAGSIAAVHEMLSQLNSVLAA